MSNTTVEITRLEYEKIPVHKWFKDYNLLVAIKLNPGANASALAGIMGKDRSFVSRRIKICVSRNLIAAKYIINENKKRAIHAELTSLGFALLEVFGLSLAGIASDKLLQSNAEIELLKQQKTLLEELL